MFKNVIPNIDFIKQEAIHTLDEIGDFNYIKNHILDYCAKSEVFISDIRFLRKEIMLFKPFEIYTVNVFKTSVGLANYLYENVNILIKTRTVIEDEITVIDYDGQPVAMINRLEGIKDFPIESIVFPIRKEEVAYFPPEIEMIDVYRTLYSPNKCDFWMEAIGTQRQLFKLMINRLSTYHNVSLKTLKTSEGGDDCKQCKTGSVDSIKKFILRHLIGKFILIGNYAINRIAEIPEPEDSRELPIVQVITQNDYTDDIFEIKNTLTRITDAVITFEVQKLHIPKDLITKRIRLFVNTGTGTKNRKAIMDIFNSGQFEILPYIEIDKQKIGNPFVIARFMLIDLWIYKIIRERGLIDPTKADRLMNHLVKNLKLILDKKYKNLVFGLKYFGVFKDPEVMKKIEKMNSKKKSYIPEIYKKNNNKLLEFN